MEAQLHYHRTTVALEQSCDCPRYCARICSSGFRGSLRSQPDHCEPRIRPRASIHMPVIDDFLVLDTAQTSHMLALWHLIAPLQASAWFRIA